MNAGPQAALWERETRLNAVPEAAPAPFASCCFRDVLTTSPNLGHLERPARAIVLLVAVARGTCNLKRSLALRVTWEGRVVLMFLWSAREHCVALPNTFARLAYGRVTTVAWL